MHAKSHIPSHNLIPNPLAPVIQIYELPLATICYNLQQSYYTSNTHSLAHSLLLAHTQACEWTHLLRSTYGGLTSSKP